MASPELTPSAKNLEYVRFILLLVQEGTDVLRKIIISGLEGGDLSEFLRINKEQIKRSKRIRLEQENVLYPPSGDASDLSKWDISLLAYFCRRYFTEEDSKDRQAVHKIKGWRNKYFHSVDASVDAGDFEDLSKVILTISDKEDVIARIKELGMDTTLQQLKPLDEKLSESIDGRFGKRGGNLDTPERGTQEVFAEVRELREQFRTLSIQDDWEANVDIYTVEGLVNVSMRSGSQDAVTRVKSALLSACQKGLQNTSRNNTLNEKVENVFHDIGGVGGKVVNVREGSVVFIINCPSLTDLIYVIDYIYSPKMQYRLHDIANELQKATGHDVYLAADIQPKSLKELLTKLQGGSTRQVKEEVGAKTFLTDSKAKALIEKIKKKKSQSGQAGSTEIDKQTRTISRKRKKSISESQKLLFTIDNNANRCREKIKEIEDMVNSKSKEIQQYPQVKAWIKELKHIEEKLDFKPIEIAVIGNTGEGKSSLLNAVLDRGDVLPTSGLKACTATVVEVVQSKTKFFEAEIEFLEEKEWFDELRNLFKDLSDENGTFTKTEPERNSDVYTSYCKIVALYGEINEFDVLSKKTELTKWLGKTKYIEENKLDDFKKVVESYIEQEPGTGQSFWPIVRSVRLKLPGCDVCSSGAVLVDLPGRGDSDAARNAVAKSHLEKCDRVWIVSNINRAINDRTAHELLEEHLRNQLYMNGQFDQISFICTKTDIVNDKELRRELKKIEIEIQTKELDEELLKLDEIQQKVSANIEDLTLSINQEKDELEQLKSWRDGSSQDTGEPMDSEDEEETKEEIENLESSIKAKEDECRNRTTELQSLIHQRRTKNMSISELCAKARNTYCETRIKQEFTSYYKAIKNASINTNSDSKEMEQMRIKDLAEKLEVFCCSSTDYQYIKHKVPKNEVFSYVEDTQIPKLRNFVHDITSKRKKETLTDTFSCLNGLVSSVLSYLSDKEDKKLSKLSFTKETIDIKLQKHKKDMDSVLNKLDTDLREIFAENLNVSLKAGASAAENEAMEICAGWGVKHSRDKSKLGGLHHRTYMAVVKRHGVFLDIDFNEELAEPIFSSIAFTWGNTFSDSGSVKKTLDEFKEDALLKRKQFLDELFENFGIQDNASNLRETQGYSASLKITDTVKHLYYVISLWQRRITGMVIPYIQKCLSEVYKECAEIKGKGMMEKLKFKLSESIEEKRRTMFKEVTKEMAGELQSIQAKIVGTMREKCNDLFEDLKIALEPLWDDSTILSTAFYQDIRNFSSEVQMVSEEFKKDTEDPILKRPKLRDQSESSEPVQGSSK